MNLEFDKEIKSKFNNNVIEYGIVNGDNTIVFIKAGQNGSLYGYNNKYIKMAKRLNSKYGISAQNFYKHCENGKKTYFSRSGL